MNKGSLHRNALANVLQMLVGAGLLFVLYRYINATLGIALFGVWSVVLATASASRLANMGVGAGMTRFVAKYQALEDGHTAASMVETSAVTLSVVLGVMLPILYFPLMLILGHVFSGQYLTEAQMLLPYALVSLWLGDVATVFDSGLEGLQRMDLRAGIVITGQLLRLILAIWLIPVYGLLGLAEAQIAQGAFQLLIGWIVLRQLLPQLGWLPLRWSRRAFRELIGYGANLQLATLFMLLMDPVTKAFMAKFGGAAAAGYFEMANQLVLKVRALIVTANQAIVPKVAALAETDPTRLVTLYRENMRALVFVTLPITALLVVWAGGFSWLLTGEYRPQLVHLIEVFAVAWGLNIFAGPAYFINMGTGHIRWNTYSHMLMGVLNVALCWLMGARFGVVGVAFAYAIALAVPSTLLAVVFAQKNKMSWTQQFERADLWLLILSVIVGSFGQAILTKYGAEKTFVFYLVLLMPFPLLGSVLWFHPSGCAIRSHLLVKQK